MEQVYTWISANWETVMLALMIMLPQLRTPLKRLWLALKPLTPEQKAAKAEQKAAKAEQKIEKKQFKLNKKLAKLPRTLILPAESEPTDTPPTSPEQIEKMIIEKVKETLKNE